MNAHEVLDSYVRDVALCLPREKRNDVAFELRSLLGDELAAKAQAQSRPADKEMAMELLKNFGTPSVAATRYHQRPAIIEPADTHHFLMWTLTGAVCICVLSALGPAVKRAESSDAFLKWLGILALIFGAKGWLYRRNPGTLRWKPKRDPFAMGRPLAAFLVVLTLFFPVFMYTAPKTFVDFVFMGAIHSAGLETTAEFRVSWQHAAVITLLLMQAGGLAAIAIEGRRLPWIGWMNAIAHCGLGVLFLMHATVMTNLASGKTFTIFESAAANTVAMPIFGLVGAGMLLCSFYEGYQERSRIMPAPMLEAKRA